MSPAAITPDQFSTFGELLRHLRRQARLTQRELAIAVGYSDTQISRIEQNQRVPDAATITALFITALYIEDQPRWVARLLELAKATQVGGISTADERSFFTTPNNLPIQLTSFIGREKELADVKKLLHNSPILMLVGPGGTGKTRLSIQAASELLGQYPDGVWLVDLAPILDPQLVPRTTAIAIGLRDEPQRPVTDMLCDYLRGKRMLIILDNCEHLVDACAQMADRLLHATPNARILASSREALGIAGEVTYQVPSLELPDLEHLPSVVSLSQYEAVKLFIDRASAAVPSFTVTKDNAPALAQICHRLDGIPLAIELAAAKVRVLSLEQIAQRLDDRFRLLTDGSRTALERHQTLRAAIDWSYNLLAEQEKILFRRLAVFVGGWTLEAAKAVCSGDGIESDQILDLLSQLVHKSLVIFENAGTESRYHRLETIHQYAREKWLEAGGSEIIRRQHLSFFVKLTGQAAPELYRSNQLLWLNRLDAELDNLRMALAWALATDVEAGLRIIAISWHFWRARGYLRETAGWLGKLLDRYDIANVLRVQASVLYASCLNSQGRVTQSMKILEESLQLARTLSDSQAEAASLRGLGSVLALHGRMGEGMALIEQSLAIYQTLGDKLAQADTMVWLSWNNNDLEQSKIFIEKGLALFRELGDPTGIAECLNELAKCTYWGGDFNSPTKWLDEALTIFRQLEDQPGEALVLENLGSLAFWQSDYQQACTYYEESILLSERIGDYMMSDRSRVKMAYAVLRQGDIAQASTMFDSCIRHFQEIENMKGLVYAMEGLASLSVHQENFERAALIFAWADSIRETIGDHRPPIEQTSVERDLAVIHSHLNDITFANAHTKGHAMTVEEAIAFALQVESA